MNQNLITKINGVDIITVDYQGETYVPIKPICNAIGIDPDSQRNKLNADEFFNSTTGDNRRSWCRQQGARNVLYPDPRCLRLARHN